LLWKTGASFRRLYYATDTRADGLMLGCLVECLVSWGLMPKSGFFEIGLKSLALISALFLGYVVLTIKSSNPILFQGVLALASLAIAIIIAVLVVWPESRGTGILRFRPLVWVGRISYGLYLWHWPVRGFVFKSAELPSARQIVTAAILSFAIASLSFYFVERPFLLWKKRFTHA
jgi:peptidoglycan/LPS O-acetylase OafA/YrhL